METITVQEAETLINEGGKVVVDVWMNNCNPCQQYFPIFEEVAKTMPHIKFVKVQLPDDVPGKDAFRIKGLGVKSAPTTFVFHDGSLRGFQGGVLRPHQLARMAEAGIYEKDIDQYSVMELKAAVFDCMSQIEPLMNSKNLLITELQKRSA